MSDPIDSPLDIEFLDPVDDIEVGRTFRFHVLQRNARGEQHTVRIDELDFAFAPIVWGQIKGTADAGVGLIEVIEVVEPDDVFLAPHYSVSATYKPRAGRTLAPKKRVRITAVALEIELAFAIGQENKWKPFEPLSLPRPVDLSTAKLSDPSVGSILVREGRVFLRLERTDALPHEVALTFPNGETAALRLEGALRGLPLETDDRGRLQPAPGSGSRPRTVRLEKEDVVAQEPPEAREPELSSSDEDAATASLREDLRRLRRYVGSFGGAGKRRPDPTTTESIRKRISAEATRVRERLEVFDGDAKAELDTLFKAALELVPDFLREQPAAPAGGAS